MAVRAFRKRSVIQPTTTASSSPRLQTDGAGCKLVDVGVPARESNAGRSSPAKCPAIHRAVVEQCDALDGVKDGIIENPTQCRPRLEALTCKGEDTNQCLTPPQLEIANAI